MPWGSFIETAAILIALAALTIGFILVMADADEFVRLARKAREDGEFADSDSRTASLLNAIIEGE